MKRIACIACMLLTLELSLAQESPEPQAIAQQFLAEISKINRELLEEYKASALGNEYSSNEVISNPNCASVYFAFMHENDPSKTLELVWWNASDSNIRLMALSLLVLSSPTDISEKELKSFIGKCSILSDVEKEKRYKEIDTFRDFYSEYAKALIKVAPKWFENRFKRHLEFKVLDKSQKYPLSHHSSDQKNLQSEGE